MQKLLFFICCMCVITAQVHAAEVNSAADFNAKVVGKALVSGNNTAKISAKSLTATINGKTVKANWQWSGKYFCRTEIDKPNGPKDVCQKVTLDGKTVSFISDKGAGRATKWTIK